MALEAEEMELPDFLENSSEDEIHEKMLGNLPDDIDKAEGGFPSFHGGDDLPPPSGADHGSGTALPGGSHSGGKQVS